VKSGKAPATGPIHDLAPRTATTEVTPARSLTSVAMPELPLAPPEEEDEEEDATSQTQLAEGGKQEPGVPSAASCAGGRPAARAPAGTAAEERLGMISTRSVGQAGSPVAMSTTVPGAMGEGAPIAGMRGTGVEIRAHAGVGGSCSCDRKESVELIASEGIVHTWAQSGNEEASEAP
jgi:hypothetical protein